jgi:hypothetical protein
VSIKSPSGQTSSRWVRPLRAVAATVAATLLPLLFAAAAAAAAADSASASASASTSTSGVSYTGTTSQGHALKFKVSGGKIVGLKYRMDDTCPDGHILTEVIAFQPITITGGRFSHTFGPSGQPTSVSGKISGKHATGSMRDRSMSPREHALCHGSATFSAHT